MMTKRIHIVRLLCLGLLATTASAQLSVLNGNFEDTTGMSGGPSWFGGAYPPGWSSIRGASGLGDYMVGAGAPGNTTKVYNLDGLQLYQDVGANTFNARVTLTFDNGCHQAGNAYMTARITDTNNNVLASISCSNGSQTLTAYVPANTPVRVAFLKHAGGGSPWIDNVAVTAVAATPPGLAVVNGNFSNLAGLTGSGWRNGIPSGWAAKTDAAVVAAGGNLQYTVNDSNGGATPPTANLNVLGPLRQNLGTLPYNANVTLTYDIGVFGSGDVPYATVRITDGVTVLALANNVTTGTSQMLTAYVPANTPVYIEFVHASASAPALDNVSVAAVEAPLTVSNGDFQNTAGMTYSGGWWGGAYPVGWQAHGSVGAYMEYDFTAGSGNAWNLDSQQMSQNVGSLPYNAMVTLTFDFIAGSAGQTVYATAQITDGNNTVLASVTCTNGLAQTLATYVPSNTAVRVSFLRNPGNTPYLDNVSVASVAMANPPALAVVNGGFSETTGMSNQGNGWYAGVPRGWSGTWGDWALNGGVFNVQGQTLANNGLSQSLGFLGYLAHVTVNFDYLNTWGQYGRMSALLLTNSHVAVSNYYDATVFGPKSMVVSNVPPGTRVSVQFFRDDYNAATGLDNVSVTVKPVIKPGTLIRFY